jgi:nicotinamide mononucleotide adenylyltransferase
MPGRFDQAAMFGRYQPLHNDHLGHLLAAKSICEKLWIGLTLPDRGVAKRSAAREAAASNPLTFFERVAIVRAALGESGVSADDYMIVPFPIEQPEKLTNYVDPDVVCLVAGRGPERELKAALLRGLGYKVERLTGLQSTGITGTRLRHQIMRGDPIWRGSVPASTASLLDRIDLRSRLLALNACTEDAESRADAV